MSGLEWDGRPASRRDILRHRIRPLKPGRVNAGFWPRTTSSPTLPFIAAEPNIASGAGPSAGRLHDPAIVAASATLTGWSAR